MLKRLDSTYMPSWGRRRSEEWIKAKKDYLEGMGDSLDLVPIGGWRGQGRKKRWVSPWLLATFDVASGTFGSVCRVMSGFSDAFYREQTVRYIGHEFGEGGAEGEDFEEQEGEEEGEEEEEDDDEGEGGGDGDGDGSVAVYAAAGHAPDIGNDRSVREQPLLRRTAEEGVETNERPPFWFTPTEVWEIRGADITLSPTHMAAVGMVHPQRGLSMRFPRFIRKRPDKRLSDATTPQQLAALFRKQAQGQGTM
jgi:DNA ligase-1